ncbi:hypothetical protein ZWY2020_017016 [Hordeum vulgare]|nr:hypothetical protein ZWY2020_017016 [Hordeum vulgare]
MDQKRCIALLLPAISTLVAIKPDGMLPVEMEHSAHRTFIMAMSQVQHGLHDLLMLLQGRSPSPQAALVVSVLLVCPLLVLFVARRLGTPSTATATARAREDQLSKLPSPPRRLPVIGHLHLVGPLPHISLRDLAVEHGRDGLMLLRLGAVPTLVVSSTSAAQAVLRTHDHVFASRAYSPVTDILFYGSTDVAFCPYGEHWRQVKKIATTHLLTNKKVRSYRHARENEVRLVIAKIREAAIAGTTMDLSDLLNAFTNDIVCHAVAGKSFRKQGYNKLFRELVEANSSLIGGFNLEDYFPVLVKLDLIKRMVCAKARKVNKMWDDLLNSLIDEHASRPASDHSSEDSDFIDLLLSIQQEYNLTRDHIKAQLEVMFEAGTDTSFIVLEYAMVRLMQNPHLMKKLQAEKKQSVKHPLLSSRTKHCAAVMVYPLHGIHELVFVLLLCPLLVLLAVRRLATPSTAAATARAREELLSRLPSPGSRLPVIGHLHLVGSLPHISLRDLAAKHGRDGLMLLRLGAVPTLVVSSPSAAQAVLRTHDHVFASRPYSLVSEILLYGPSDVAFCPYGEHWRQVKKISTTHLLTNKKVRSYRHAREHEVRLVVAKIHNAASECTAVDMSELLNTFTNDIVCHAVSGKLFRERGHNKLFRELVEANSLLLGGFNLVDYFPKLVQMDIIKRMVCAKAQKVKKMWDNLLNNIIDEHANKSVPEHNNEDSDFTDVLLSIQQEYKLTRDHIKAQLESMFEAGTDTSFIVLEYAMVQLMQNPHLMNKLQAEGHAKNNPRRRPSPVPNSPIPPPPPAVLLSPARVRPASWVLSFLAWGGTRKAGRHPRRRREEGGAADHGRHVTSSWRMAMARKSSGEGRARA